MEPQQQQPLELRHLPFPELAELADLTVLLGGGDSDAGSSVGAGVTSALPLHSHVLATGSALLRGVFSSTEVGDRESRERAVQQALAAEAPADVLAFLSLLYDPVHVKEAMASPFAAAAPTSPTKATGAAAASAPHVHLAAATAGTNSAAAGGPQAQAAVAAAPAVGWGAAVGPVPNMPLWPGAAAALQQGGGAGAAAPFNFAAAPVHAPVLSFQFGAMPATVPAPAACTPAAATALALGRRAEAVLRLADKLDCSLVVEVCDRFLSSELPIEGPDVLRWLSIADRCSAKRLRARCVRALLDAQLQPPAAPVPGVGAQGSSAGTAGDGRLPQQLDPSYWKSLSTDAAWLLFESLLKACRAAHGQQPMAGGGLLGHVRSQLPPAAALEAWCGVGTLFSS